MQNQNKHIGNKTRTNTHAHTYISETIQPRKEEKTLRHAQKHLTNK